MQLFKPVSSSLSGGVFPHLFMWRPLIMNETEVSEESEERWWYRAKGRRGGDGDCAPPWRGNREEVLQCSISNCSMWWTHNNSFESLSLMQLCSFCVDSKWHRFNLEPRLAARNGVTFLLFCGFSAAHSSVQYGCKADRKWLMHGPI